MRDRDTEVEYIRACAAFDLVGTKDNGIHKRVKPPTSDLVDEFIRRTGDGEIRPHIIELGDKEAREEATDGVAYAVWRNLYGSSSEYAKSLRAQAVGKFVSAHHLLFMAEQVDE